MTSDEDDEDLLGPTAQPRPKPVRKPRKASPKPGKRRPGRPTKAEAEAYAALKVAEQAVQEPDPTVSGLGLTALPDATAFHRPVTRTFLATILGMEPRRLAKRLAKCPVVEWAELAGKRTPFYDFKVAISYCVDPRIDVGQWIKSQNAMTLPPAISKAFWDAMRSKQMVEERAGDLWRTADVIEVCGRAAIAIKQTSQLWIENLPGKAALTSEQYESLMRQVTDLQIAIHQALVDDVRAHQTPPSLAEVDAMVAAVEPEIGDDE